LARAVVRNAADKTSAALMRYTITNMEGGTANGHTLLEMMAVVAIVAIMASMGAPLLQQQLAQREVETVARRFIQHAQFARQVALFGDGLAVQMVPLEQQWSRGWRVIQTEVHPHATRSMQQVLLSQGDIAPVEIDERSSGFAGPNGQHKRIGFDAFGAAKSQSGGFVANRVVFRHQSAGGIERHAILSSGGRWRLCDPAQDRRACR
jgi:type IV fimbrial biogenesis protein FimT